jgi:glutaredoxin
VKNILFILVIFFAAYKGWNYLQKESIEPLYSKPYVVVYGRNSCGWTKRMIDDLKSSGISYEYQIVDDKEVADLLHHRMQLSGISTRRYNLPVVDVNGSLSIRPESQTVLSDYQAAL